MNGEAHPFFVAVGADCLDVLTPECLDSFSGEGTLGAPDGPLVWTEIAPVGDKFAFVQGQRYAVLASVSKNDTLASIAAKMKSEGFDVTYSWEYGTPTRGQYPIDTWLASLPADTTSNHRWVYGEANLTGPNVSFGVDAPWPLTIYHIAHVFQAEPAPPGEAPAALPTTSSSSSSSTTRTVLTVGAGVGVVGLLGWAAWRFL